MALSNNDADINANANKTRNYKLCSVCKFRGKKGSPLVSCTICKSVHSSNSYSTNTQKNIDNMQYMCTTCKIKRKSLQAPTIPNIGRRSGQSSNVNSRRGSASQSTTPSLSDIHTTRRTLGSRITLTTINSKNSTNICTIPSHADLQHQNDKIVNTLYELKILLH